MLDELLSKVKQFIPIYLNPNNSTSNTKKASPGMTGGLPYLPYP